MYAMGLAFAVESFRPVRITCCSALRNPASAPCGRVVCLPCHCGATAMRSSNRSNIRYVTPAAETVVLAPVTSVFPIDEQDAPNNGPSDMVYSVAEDDSEPPRLRTVNTSAWSERTSSRRYPHLFRLRGARCGLEPTISVSALLLGSERHVIRALPMSSCLAQITAIRSLPTMR